jgi:hypothetical protein
MSELQLRMIHVAPQSWTFLATVSYLSKLFTDAKLAYGCCPQKALFHRHVSSGRIFLVPVTGIPEGSLIILVPAG